MDQILSTHVSMAKKVREVMEEVRLKGKEYKLRKETKGQVPMQTRQPVKNKKRFAASECTAWRGLAAPLSL